MSIAGGIRITLELTPEQAAGLKRFAEKVTWERAASVLYPHIKQEIRSEQASEIIAAFAVLDKALDEADVRSWPWIANRQILP